MSIIHDLPPPLVGLLIVAVFVSAGCGGLVIARRWGRKRGLHALVDNGVVGWIFSATLVIYAIALGLIAVATWGNAARAEAVASQEAAEIAALYGDLGGYPEPIATELRRTLVRYTRFVVEEAWPAQRRGEGARQGAEILDEFTRLLHAFDPATDGRRALHAEALRAFDELIEARRERVEAVAWAVPGRLWSVVLVGAVLAIVASYVFNAESLALHALMTGLLSAMIGLLVFFIASTDRPYRGAIGVAPTAYELVLRDVMNDG